MRTRFDSVRLTGLEPDNLLAFMALLGLLRSLEESRPSWHGRVSWTVDEPPLRPCLHLAEAIEEDAIVQAAIEGLDALAPKHDFGKLQDLKLPVDGAREQLCRAAGGADQDPYTADMWAAFLSDVVVSDQGTTKPTPLCLLGGGQTRFLKNLALVPNQKIPKRKTPPSKTTGRNKTKVSESDCIRECLFGTWLRLDDTLSFRWDPSEDVRYALRARAPTDDKEPTQHGANRLAAIGLSVLTVVPTVRLGEAQLTVLGGGRDRGFTFEWPIWREPTSLAGIRGLLSHPHLNRAETRTALGIVELRLAHRISYGKYMNFTRAERSEGLERRSSSVARR